jgi:hypothetical protein
VVAGAARFQALGEDEDREPQDSTPVGLLAISEAILWRLPVCFAHVTGNEMFRLTAANAHFFAIWTIVGLIGGTWVVAAAVSYKSLADNSEDAAHPLRSLYEFWRGVFFPDTGVSNVNSEVTAATRLRKRLRLGYSLLIAWMMAGAILFLGD